MLDESSGLPMNFPLLLGGEDIVSDEVAKLKVEEAFGQLNLQSLFGFEKHIFRSVVYSTFRLNEAKTKLLPHIYVQKAYTNNVYVFNYLSTPYADLNLESTFEEIDFMSKALAGVFRRAGKQEEIGSIDNEEKFEICKRDVDHLGGFMHYKIFSERSFRDQPKTVKKPAFMYLGLYVQMTPDFGEVQCVGDCGMSFTEKDIEGSDITICPNCKGGLVTSPPILKVKNIQFLKPPKFATLFESEEEQDPSTYLGYLTGIFMPRNISLTVNRLAPEFFSELVTVPSQAFYSSKLNFEDFVKLQCNYRVDNGDVNLFVSISDSKFGGSKFEDVLVSSLASVTLNRDLVEGFQKGYTLEKILRNSIINDWILTDKIDLEQIGQYSNIDDIPERGA